MNDIAFHLVHKRIGYANAHNVANFAFFQIHHTINLGRLAHCATVELAVFLASKNEHVHLLPDAPRNVGLANSV